MFELTQGDLLKADAEALVNTVNTEGIMGKGIALQFRKLFPDNYREYKKACQDGTVQPGKMFIYYYSLFNNPKYIINFPTKRHWRSKSKIEDIDAGLQSLVNEVKNLGITSIAVPPLGCGLGGLSWEVVRERMRLAFAQLPTVRWMIYEPAHSSVALLSVSTKRPKITIGRAVICGLIKRYLAPGFESAITSLEIQKLVYFIVEAGENLNNLKFEKAHYGPYSDVLRHVLEALNGHFIHGYSNKLDDTITLDPSIEEEIDIFLNKFPDTHERFERVSKLVEGFETPFGMELLATVHWAAKRENSGTIPTTENILATIQKWNPRKASLMKSDQIQIAWRCLVNQGWL